MAKTYRFFGHKYTLEPDKKSTKGKVYKVSLTQLPSVIFNISEVYGNDPRMIQNSMALEVFKEVQREGHMVEPVLLVGGKPATSVYSAKLGQLIQWIETAGYTEEKAKVQSDFFNQMLKEAHRIAQQTAPKDSGQFARNFVWITESGAVLGGTAPSKKDWAVGETVFLVNRAPYGRKIEELKRSGNARVVKGLGKTTDKRVQADQKRGFSRFSFKAPNGVFRVVSKRIRAKFKPYIQTRMALVRKQYVRLPQTLFGINTTLKDGRYPAVRFVYRGAAGYAAAQRGLAKSEANKIISALA